ncbi:PF07599 family protein [Leptospira interrogans str. 2002000626]|uniref:PF07599 family protein n=6 Tax=Leptospira interrogans TaxID=173 RepID=A0A829DBN5_LEPIR|nr:PF07599 family protein [Leptospira interrogans str. 2002000626]EMY25111.1 PF07599 family protein [Leptospira interrogans serovar Australis str. 200703203]
MKMMNIILTYFFLLETLENLYATYVEYFLKQTFLDSMQKISKMDQKQNEIPVLLIFRILIFQVISSKGIFLSLSDNKIYQRYKL